MTRKEWIWKYDNPKNIRIFRDGFPTMAPKFRNWIGSGLTEKECKDKFKKICEEWIREAKNDPNRAVKYNLNSIYTTEFLNNMVEVGLYTFYKGIKAEFVVLDKVRDKWYKRGPWEFAPVYLDRQQIDIYSKHNKIGISVKAYKKNISDYEYNNMVTKAIRSPMEEVWLAQVKDNGKIKWEELKRKYDK